MVLRGGVRKIVVVTHRGVTSEEETTFRNPHPPSLIKGNMARGCEKAWELFNEMGI